MHEILFPHHHYYSTSKAMNDEEMCLTLRPTFTLTERTANARVELQATWFDLNGRPHNRVMASVPEEAAEVRKHFLVQCLAQMREGRG